MQYFAKDWRPVIDRWHRAGLANGFRHIGRAGDEYRVLEAHDRLLVIDSLNLVVKFRIRHFFENVFHILKFGKYIILSGAYIFHIVNASFTLRKMHFMVSQDSPDHISRKSRGRPRGWDDKTDQNTIKSLDRAMVVFEFLSEAQGKTLSVLASDLGQSAATVYRILVTLEGRGLVEFDQVAQVWHIGPRAFVIGARFLKRTSLVERARPFLRRLMEDTGETANLGIEQNGQVLFVSQVETNASIRAFFPPGTLSQMHASGIGKALMAQMETSRLETLLAKAPLERFTEFTLIVHDALMADLAVTRLRGFAIDGEERNLGMRCIAAPIFDINGEAVAGISVSGPTSRVGSEQITELSRAVVAAAKELSAAIGGDVSAP
jgi:IclR family acetate operon transcriptional repressor